MLVNIKKIMYTVNYNENNIVGEYMSIFNFSKPRLFVNSILFLLLTVSVFNIIEAAVSSRRSTFSSNRVATTDNSRNPGIGATAGTALPTNLDGITCKKEFTKCMKQEDVCGENYYTCAVAFDPTIINPASDPDLGYRIKLCDSVLGRCDTTVVDNIIKWDAPGVNIIGGIIYSELKQAKEYIESSAGRSCKNQIYTLIKNSCDGQIGNCAYKYPTTKQYGTTPGIDIMSVNMTRLKTALEKLDKAIIDTNPACKVVAGSTSTDVFSDSWDNFKTEIQSDITREFRIVRREYQDSCTEIVPSCLNCGGSTMRACVAFLERDANSGDFTTASITALSKQTESSCGSLLLSNQDCLKGYGVPKDMVWNSSTTTSELIINDFAQLWDCSSSTSTSVCPAQDSIKDRILTQLTQLSSNNSNMQRTQQCLNTLKNCVRLKCGEGVELQQCLVYKSTKEITDSRSFELDANGMPYIDDGLIRGFCINEVVQDTNCQDQFAVVNKDYSSNFLLKTSIGENDVYSGVWEKVKGDIANEFYASNTLLKNKCIKESGNWSAERQICSYSPLCRINNGIWSAERNRCEITVTMEYKDQEVERFNVLYGAKGPCTFASETSIQKAIDGNKDFDNQFLKYGIGMLGGGATGAIGADYAANRFLGEEVDHTIKIKELEKRNKELTDQIRNINNNTGNHKFETAEKKKKAVDKFKKEHAKNLKSIKTMKAENGTTSAGWKGTVATVAGGAVGGWGGMKLADTFLRSSEAKYFSCYTIGYDNKKQVAGGLGDTFIAMPAGGNFVVPSTDNSTNTGNFR